MSIESITLYKYADQESHSSKIPLSAYLFSFSNSKQFIYQNIHWAICPVNLLLTFTQIGLCGIHQESAIKIHLICNRMNVHQANAAASEHPSNLTCTIAVKNSIYPAVESDGNSCPWCKKCVSSQFQHKGGLWIIIHHKKAA